MAVKPWIKEHLEQRNVRYEQHHHRPAYTMQEVAAAEHVSGYHVAKVVVAVANEKPVLLVLPAPNHVDFGLAKQALGARVVRLATEREIAQHFPDCEVGAVPPLRHWEGVDIWMDRSMSHFGEFLFQAGTHEDAVVMNFRDWLTLVEPLEADFARLAPVGA